MLNLPKSTEVNARITKQKFYEKLTVSASLKESFIQEIQAIYWRNKISPQTMNLETVGNVSEIEVFEIKLVSGQLNEEVLRQIDKGLPYYILYVLEYHNRYKAAIGYKEVSPVGYGTSKVTKYYYTDWVPYDELPVHIDGLSIDTAYENLLRQIAGDRLSASKNTDQPIGEAIEVETRRDKIKRRIDALEHKIAKEPQLNRQIQMRAEVKRLAQEMEYT